MALDVSMIARIRKVLESIDAEIPGGDPREVTLTQQLEILVASGAAPYTNIVSSGRAFWSGNTTAVAAVVAIPTTAINFAIYNGDVDGGRSLIIDWVAAQNVVSTAVVAQAQMLALIGQTRETAPTGAGLSIKRLNGAATGGNNDTKVIVITGGTALPGSTGVVANWFPIGQAATKPSAVGTPGYGMYQRVDGGIIVAPGRYFALQVLANVVGETFVTFVGWHEKQITLA